MPSRAPECDHETSKLASLLMALMMLLAASLCASTAFAAEQVWGFKGTISSYASGALPDAPVGTVVRGQFRFDDTEIDTNASPNEGAYSFIALAIAIEGISMMHFGLSTGGDVVIHNDLATGPDFEDKIGLEDLSFTMSFPDLGIIGSIIEMSLTEVSATAPTVLTSDALPSSPPPALSSFTTMQELHVLGYTTDFLAGISEFEEPGTVDLPIIPDDVIVNTDGSVTWVFSTLGISLCASGCWVDPPISSSFTYSMTNGALFTDIVDFPSGFGTAIDVLVGGSSLGTFGPGDSVDFSSFPGGGVSSFVVSGIVPGADLSSAEAFPLQLAFDSADSDFTMTSAAPVTAPGLAWPAVALLVGGAALLGSRRLRS